MIGQCTARESDVIFYPDHIEVFVESSKTDQYTTVEG